MKYSEHLNEEDFKEELATNGSIKWFVKLLIIKTGR
jgi:hypothetical protein